MKTLIEIHALQNFAPSNLNRDDTGAPKDALFGGTRRGRVSSQCIKRSVRKHFEQKKLDGLFTDEDLAVRTKRVLQSIADRLKGKRDNDEVIIKAETALSYVKLKTDDEGKTQYLLFLGNNEISGLAQAINEYWDQIKTDEDAATKKGKTKKAKAKEAPKEVKKRIESIFDGVKAVDVALFGRMLADMPDKNQDAACQVAHAISTHAIEREFDFYTAVDDRKPEDTSGADMMGTIEFNSGCFYRYAVIDWEKLIENLQKDQDLAHKGLRAFLEGFVVAEPTGKQNTFAAHNPPEFVSISVRKNSSPRNLANAFEKAIWTRKDESLTQKSAEAFIAKAKSLQEAYGGEGKTMVMNLTDAKIDGLGDSFASLTKLLDATVAAVRG